MAKLAVFDLTNEVTDNDRMLVAVCIALIVHMVIVLGITFTEPEPPIQNSRSIDVILVNTPAKKAPKEANFLAQENQIGTGDKKIPKPEPPAKRIVSQGNSPIKHADKSERQEAEPIAKQKLVTQQKASTKVVNENHPVRKHDQEQRPKLTPERLQQQIAQYGNEIRLKEQGADQTKIKFANSVSAHQYVAAQYVKDWERKVERTGNINYPAIASKKNFSGTLTMDVGIKEDGSIYSVRISRSSGYPALDEAAKRIVRMSAPFPALPSDLLKELNVLVITRKWKFSDESGMTTP
jgi:periplasmic protein TonB